VVPEGANETASTKLLKKLVAPLAIVSPFGETKNTLENPVVLSPSELNVTS
jgi:hypothetical protein